MFDELSCFAINHVCVRSRVEGKRDFSVAQRSSIEQEINAACPRDFLRVDHDEVLSRLFEDKMARLKLHQTFAFDTEPSPISITRNRRPTSPIFFNSLVLPPGLEFFPEFP